MQVMPACSQGHQQYAFMLIWHWNVFQTQYQQRDRQRISWVRHETDQNQSKIKDVSLQQQRLEQAGTWIPMKMSQGMHIDCWKCMGSDKSQLLGVGS